MKKLILSIISIGVACAILQQSNIFEALLTFLLVGAIPGTPYVLSPTVMMLLFLAIGWLVLFHATFVRMIDARHTEHVKKRQIQRKKRMPVRRFSEV
jgi:hypothetical protein